MNQKPTVGFTATGTIKRSEFGLSYTIPGVTDEVQIQIEAEANGDTPKGELVFQKPNIRNPGDAQSPGFC